MFSLLFTIVRTTFCVRDGGEEAVGGMKNLAAFTFSTYFKPEPTPSQSSRTEFFGIGSVIFTLVIA